MTERKAIECVEDAKKINGYDAYRTVGGHVVIVENDRNNEVFFSDNYIKTKRFISKCAKYAKEKVKNVEAEMERMMINY